MLYEKIQKVTCPGAVQLNGEKYITLMIYGYIRRDTWLVKYSRNLVKPNTYLKRDHILTQRGGENRSKT